jgi:hypothetical protein
MQVTTEAAALWFERAKYDPVREEFAACVASGAITRHALDALLADRAYRARRAASHPVTEAERSQRRAVGNCVRIAKNYRRKARASTGEARASFERGAASWEDTASRLRRGMPESMT